MNRINRDNYEAFLLDMVEGTITAADREELVLFLAQNPDLDVDLDGLEFATLDEEGITFPHKETLKKTGASRFDELAVKQIEEGLTPAEQTELNAIVASNKEYTKHLSAFAQTVLVADRSVIFKNKESLKQGAVIRPLWANALRAAAAVALLVGAVFAFQQYSGTQEQGIAKVIDTKGKTIPTYKRNAGQQSNVAQAVTNAPDKVVKTVIPKNNIVVPDNNNDIAYAKTEPLYLNPTQAAIEFEPTNLDTDQPVAFYMAVPYLNIPEEKPTLLNNMLASLRKRIDTGVKDEEIAHRLDTITKRGPEFSDLAFIGSKGFEKLTGFRPSFRREQKDNNEVSAFSIGRYTIVTTRKKRQE